MAVFYVAASLSGAFSGLLAFAIQKLNGRAGLEGWQWIFILEGLIPVALALVIWKVLPDSPETASFLTQPERDFLVRRLADETGSGRGHVTNQDKMASRYIKAGLSDWKIWCAIVIFWGNTVGVYGYVHPQLRLPINPILRNHRRLMFNGANELHRFTATVPTVINGLGYSAANAQLLTIPIYLFASILTIIFAWWSDHARIRSPFIVAGFIIAVCGFIAQLAIPHPKYPGLTYGFLFPVAGGLYCPFIILVSWIANSLAPSSKRAVAMALFISVGNMGGIMGSNIYLEREKPKYRTGFGVSLAMCCTSVIMTFVIRWAYQRENQKRDALLRDQGEEAIRAKYSEQELLELGDKSPFFRYTL